MEIAEFEEENISINLASQESSQIAGRSPPHCRSPSTKLEGETLDLESGVQKHQDIRVCNSYNRKFNKPTGV